MLRPSDLSARFASVGNALNRSACVAAGVISNVVGCVCDLPFPGLDGCAWRVVRRPGLAGESRWVYAPHQPRSWRRANSRNAEPRRARRLSLSRTERHQRASQSRSLGPTNLAIRADPARTPAAAFERGLTASQRCSSCSTSRPGFGPGEYVTYWPEAASLCCNWRTSSWNSRRV